MVVSLEGGISYLGNSGSVAALATPIAHATQEAQVKGYEMNIRSQIGYKLMAQASSAGPRAFERALVQLADNMSQSFYKRLEIARLYGQKGIGAVESQSNVDSSTADVVVSEASWSAALWGGLQGSLFDLYQSDLATPRTNCQGMTLVSVNPSTRTLRFQVASIGTPTASDVFFFDGANANGTFSEQAGLQKILQNTSSLFNIDAGTYDVWRGNTDSTAGALSFDRLQENVMTCMSRGLVGKSTVLVNPVVWGSLLSDQAALRIYDSSYKKAEMENGAESIKFHSAAGVMEIVAHPFVKIGDYFLLPEADLMRIGSTDVTFNAPGTDDPFMVMVAGYNAIEFQAMADEQIFCKAPCRALYGSGVTV